MTNQALRDKLFHALRGDLWPGNPELDQMALADVDAIMPIVESYLLAQRLIDTVSPPEWLERAKQRLV